MELLSVFLDQHSNPQVYFNKWIIIVSLVMVGLWYLLPADRLWGKYYEIDEAEIGIGSQKIRIKPNYEDVQIAYKLWVELSTRKIGLIVDFDNDVIDELYDSWYEFFKLTRELIKDIPVHKVKTSESTRVLINAAIDVLNEGLRPHLTLWQARFKKWYRIESEKPENIDVTPQDLQKKYPQYENLVESMKIVNNNLIRYREMMKRIALDKSYRLF